MECVEYIQRRGYRNPQHRNSRKSVYLITEHLVASHSGNLDPGFGFDDQDFYRVEIGVLG